MAERTLTVRLTAIADGYRGSSTTPPAARRTSRPRRGRSPPGATRPSRRARNSPGLTLPIVGAGTAVLAMAGNFERSMRRCRPSPARAAARCRCCPSRPEDGCRHQFSASQAADAMGQLIKGGFTARQTYDVAGRHAARRCCASLDIASAADIATNVLSGWRAPGVGPRDGQRLPGADRQRVRHRRPQSSAKRSSTSAPVAKGAGLSLEETTATLGLFAENGIPARWPAPPYAVLTALLSPSGESSGHLADLGINAIDANGKMPHGRRPDQLAGSGATTGQIMEIFGDQGRPGDGRALGQARAPSASSPPCWRNPVASPRTSRTRRWAASSGSWEQFKGSVETLAISLGERRPRLPVRPRPGRCVAHRRHRRTARRSATHRPSCRRSRRRIRPAIWALGKLSNLYKPVVEGSARSSASSRHAYSSPSRRWTALVPARRSSACSAHRPPS